jgi:hypothetical protein
MKTKSSLESAFFNPRALIGFGFGAIGLLLGLVAFIGLPTQSALASPTPCTEVVFTDSNGEYGSILVSMESHSAGYPGSPCTIYFTVSSTAYPPSDPTHSSPVYMGPLTVPFGGAERYFKAFGHKSGADPEDSHIFDHYVVSGGGG